MDVHPERYLRNFFMKNFCEGWWLESLRQWKVQEVVWILHSMSVDADMLTHGSWSDEKGEILIFHLDKLTSFLCWSAISQWAFSALLQTSPTRNHGKGSHGGSQQCKLKNQKFYSMLIFKHTLKTSYLLTTLIPINRISLDNIVWSK